MKFNKWCDIILHIKIKSSIRAKGVNNLTVVKVNELHNGSIFAPEFSNLLENNVISFSPQGIAVLYGPNGTGKTTLSKTFERLEDTHFNIEYKNENYTTENSDGLFCVIKDQNNRNIISGDTKEFLLGDNIRYEFELKDKIDNNYKQFCISTSELLKNEFKISTKTNKLFELVDKTILRNALIDISNKTSKGNSIKIDELISLTDSLTDEQPELSEEQISKLNFFLKDYNDKESLVKLILQLSSDEVSVNANIKEIEENDEAIRVLNKFPNMFQCVVCDNENICVETLLESKIRNKETIIDSLSEDIKNILKLIQLTESDPFKIKNSMLSLLETGDLSLLNNLKNEIDSVKDIFIKKLEYQVNQLLVDSNLYNDWNEYAELISNRIELSDEDFLYIQEVVGCNIDKDLNVERDDKNNIKILLGGTDFLNQNRNDLPLSAGEQNFISLCFELLKAKNSNAQIIVLDDPISSFDSIYKNKIVYAILKILQGKDVLILTHNLDLLRLLEGQYKGCFKLHLFCNSEESNNGFILLKKRETEILLHIDKLIKLFRDDVFSKVQDFQLFLCSMIPFIRGYAQIIGEQNYIECTTSLMHGYRTEIVDIASVYENLISDSIIHYIDSYNISVQNILDMSVEEGDIVDNNDFPLLNKTLKHSLQYLQLRLLVERTLTTIFNIDTDYNKQLGQIIDKAFPDKDDIHQVKYRVALTSKKTLLNEFNHFEGNLSIFQPAIDISDTSLRKEKEEIYDLLERIKDDYSL